MKEVKQAFSVYYKWDEAATIFREILSRHPEDGASALYLERTRAMKAHPPGEAWDGVTVFTSK